MIPYRCETHQGERPTVVVKQYVWIFLIDEHNTRTEDVIWIKFSELLHFSDTMIHEEPVVGPKIIQGGGV